jgi:hypothetical protein
MCTGEQQQAAAAGRPAGAVMCPVARRKRL